MTEAVSEKINLVYQPANADSEQELPFRVLVLSPLNPDADIDPYEGLESVQIRSNDLSSVFAAFKPVVSLTVDDALSLGDTPLTVSFELHALADFEPRRLVHHIPGFQRLAAVRENLSLRLDDPGTPLSDDAQELLAQSGLNLDNLQSASAVSTLLAELDGRLNRQMNAVLHHPRFRAMESAWRSLHYLVDKVSFHDNCQVDVVNLPKETLRESFEDAPELTQSPLYQLVYSTEFGQFGGRPYSVIIGDYLFTPAAPDIHLLSSISRVASIAHAPFLTAADAAFFGLDDYSEFSRIRDLAAHFSQPMYEKWQAFRADPDARYVCLCMPRFLVRAAHDEDSSLGFNFSETFRKGETQGVWGNSAFALGERIATAFARYRWYVNMVGEEFGVLPTLSVTSGRGAQRGHIPTEALISDRRENDLVSQGFVPLTLRKGKSEAGFYSAASARFVEAEGNHEQTLTAQLDCQLPYILIACRFAHYLKVMQREHIGSWKTRSQIDQELSHWLRQYVSDMDNPAPGVRSRRPLRSANLTIREVEGKAGWYMIAMTLTPHFKFLGRQVTLQESGRLDRT